MPCDVAQSVACAIIGSWLDYCNSLYYGMSNTNFQRIQRVQNAAARTVCQAPRCQHHSADLLNDLHWLPVCCMLTTRSLSSVTTTSYLTCLLSPYIACSEVIFVRPTVSTRFIDKHCCSRFSWCALYCLEQSYALLTVSLVLGLSSRLTCSRDICSRSAVRASDALTRSFGRYKFFTYLLINQH